MSDLLIKVMEREDLNINRFSMLDLLLLQSSIEDDLRTNLKDILFYLFDTEVNDIKRKEDFNYVFKNCLDLLQDQIERLGHLTKQELIIWHSSIFMCLKSFKNSVETKYLLEDKEKIVVLLEDIFKTSFHKFLEYQSKDPRVYSEIIDKLCDETIIKGFRYVHKKSGSQTTTTLDREHQERGIRVNERILKLIEYKPKIENKIKWGDIK